MADLLQQWVNTDLQLEYIVEDIDVDFANGYLIGQVLHQLNQLPNFSDFVNSNTADAKIINFCLLEPALRNLGIHFDANTAVAIMNGSPGVAARLLYQVKGAAARLSRMPKVSTKYMTQKSIHPLHMPTKLPKPSYDAANHAIFEHAIRRQVKSIHTLQSEKDEKAKDTKRWRDYYQSKERDEAELDRIKAERLHQAYIHSRFIKEALEETDSPAWRIALQRKQEREDRKARFLRNEAAKRDARQEARLYSLKESTRAELEHFDAHFPKKTGVTTSVGYGLRSLSAALRETEHKRDTMDFLPSSSRTLSEHIHPHAFLNEDLCVIRQQKQKRDKRKQNLERRRKRFMYECGQGCSKAAERWDTKVIESLVEDGARSEVDIGDQLNAISQYKQVVRMNRSIREEEYGIQRDVDKQACLDRDAAAFSIVQDEYHDDIRSQRLQRDALEIALEADKHQEAKETSTSIMAELLQFIRYVANVREEYIYSREKTVFLPEALWNELKHQFSQYGAVGLLTNDNNDHGDGFARTPIEDADLCQYLNRFFTRMEVSHPLDVDSRPLEFNVSPWKPLTDQFIAFGHELADELVLGELVQYIRWRTTEVSASKDAEGVEVVETSPDVVTHKSLSAPATLDSMPPRVDELTLKIVIYGPPFSGKHVQAKRLAETLSYTLVCIDEVVTAEVTKQSDIGLEIEKHLQNGDPIPFAVYIKLIQQCESLWTDMTNENEPRSCVKGMVITGLPELEAFSVAIEQELTGYMDPDALPSPFDYASDIAPAYSKPSIPPRYYVKKSGIDFAFYLECAEDQALERCIGQVEDSVTKEAFHLVYNPPPENSTTRHRLHHANKNISNSNLMSVHYWAANSSSSALKDWHNKFETLTSFECTKSIDDVHTTMVSIIQNYIQKAQSDREAWEQSKEYQEMELMKPEESRMHELNAFETRLELAEEEVAQARVALEEAEEAKAKKDELAELQSHIEHKEAVVQDILTKVNEWKEEEEKRLTPVERPLDGIIDAEIVTKLANKWNLVESQYVASMQESFKLHHKHEKQYQDRVSSLVHNYCSIVRRPDGKQEVIDAFQQRFNAVIDTMRFDDATKQELHARTDILRDDLFRVIEVSYVANESEMHSVLTAEWIADMSKVTSLDFQMALQSELDRFRETVSILVDAFAGGVNAEMTSPFIEIQQALEQAHQKHETLQCHLFVTHEEHHTHEEGASPSKVPHQKANAKGKGKEKHAPASEEVHEVHEDPLSLEQMLNAYDDAIRQTDAFIQIALVPLSTYLNEGGTTEQSASSLLAMKNLQKALQHEHNLTDQRVKYLKEQSESSCDHIGRVLTAVEHTLEAFIQERRAREEGAAAALIKHIRSTIEQETDLPFRVLASPLTAPRFPTSVQVEKDTRICIDSSTRLLPEKPVEPPPVVQPQQSLLINDQQEQVVQDVLMIAALQTTGSHLMPLPTFVDTISRLSTLPDLLPPPWHHQPDHIIAKIGQACIDDTAGCVDANAFALKLREDADFFQRFLDPSSCV